MPHTTAPVTPPQPIIRALDRDASLRMLTQHVVGRLAFAFHDRVDIQPIHYVYAQGFLYGRTSEGAKLDTLAHNRWVAFEVDEVRGPFDWTSVVVHGAFERLDFAAATLKEREAATRAAALLENVVPNTLRVGDQVPFRTVLFRVSVDQVTGRQAMENG